LSFSCPFWRVWWLPIVKETTNGKCGFNDRITRPLLKPLSIKKMLKFGHDSRSVKLDNRAAVITLVERFYKVMPLLSKNCKIRWRWLANIVSKIKLPVISPINMAKLSVINVCKLKSNK